LNFSFFKHLNATNSPVFFRMVSARVYQCHFVL
jgi:hypothetical protein